MNVGVQLQQARMARKLSLAEVTLHTKIQPWVLEAIETDRLPEMMSPIYVKGFLTTYAKFLQLNPETVLAQVQWPQPEPAQETAPPVVRQQPAVPKISWSFQWPKLALGRAGWAVAMSAAIVVVMLVHSGRAARTASSAKRTQPAASTAAPKTAAKLASVTPLATEPIKTPEPPTLTVLATQPLELSIVANRTTWVQIRSDGKLLSQQRLPRGAQERWTAKKQLEVVVSKPSQVEVMLNGQSISPFAIAHHGRLLITHRGVTRLPEGE